MLMRMNDVRGQALVQEWSIRRDRTRMFIFIAARGKEINAIHGTINGHFSFGAAANCADFFAFRGTEARRLAFLADWTKHGCFSLLTAEQQNTPPSEQIQSAGE
jgi:hypothetical protein